MSRYPKKPHGDGEIKIPAWRQKLALSALAVAVFGLPYIAGKPIEPDAEKKPKLNEGCDLSKILGALKKPDVVLEADGTLREISGRIDTATVMTNYPACRTHLRNADEKAELVITFRPAPPPSIPSQP